MIRRRYEDKLDLSLLGAGILLSIVGLGVLLVMARTGRELASFSIYGGTLILTYASAALYHNAEASGRASATLQALDHSTIFLLVAGTYTPFCILALRGPGGLILLALVWGLAGLGIAIRLFWMRRAYRAAPILYLVQGWIGIAWAKSLVDAVGADALVLIVAGGVAYTVGIVFFLWRSFRFSNPAWHLFVLAGSACHYAAIAVYLLP